MEQLQLQVIQRTPRGKGGARELRRQGNIPAVVYGGTRENLSIAVPGEMLRRILQGSSGGTMMVSLQIGAGATTEEQLTLIKEIQREPVSGQVIHLDFQAIALTDRLTVTVPIEVVGESPGVEEGGVLQVVMFNVAAECLPTNIPSSLIVDVSAVGMNESLTVADLIPPEGVTLLDDPEESVVVVRPPTVIVEPEEEEEELLEGEEGVEGEEPAEGEEAAPEEEA